MGIFNQKIGSGSSILSSNLEPRELDSRLENELKKAIPDGSPVNVTSILGNGEAYNFAKQIKEYLANESFKVSGIDQVVYTDSINGQIIEPPEKEGGRFNIIIGNQK